MTFKLSSHGFNSIPGIRGICTIHISDKNMLCVGVIQSIVINVRNAKIIRIITMLA